MSAFEFPTQTARSQRRDKANKAEELAVVRVAKVEQVKGQEAERELTAGKDEEKVEMAVPKLLQSASRRVRRLARRFCFLRPAIAQRLGQERPEEKCLCAEQSGGEQGGPGVCSA